MSEAWLHFQAWTGSRYPYQGSGHIPFTVIILFLAHSPCQQLVPASPVQSLTIASSSTSPCLFPINQPSSHTHRSSSSPKRRSEVDSGSRSDLIQVDLSSVRRRSKKNQENRKPPISLGLFLCGFQSLQQESAEEDEMRIVSDFSRLIVLPRSHETRRRKKNPPVDLPVQLIDSKYDRSLTSVSFISLSNRTMPSLNGRTQMKKMEESRPTIASSPFPL